MVENMANYATIRLDVLVPGGRDDRVDYAAGVPSPGDRGHAPVNFHALAAATGGGFHVEVQTIAADKQAVLVLIPRRVDRALAAVRKLKSRGHWVLCTWKECGEHQIAANMTHFGNQTAFTKLRALVDVWLAASPAARAVYATWPQPLRTLDLPTPYPLDLPDWDFSVPLAKRSGIFIGTREWNVPSRRHAETLKLTTSLVKQFPGTRVTCIAHGGLLGRIKTYWAGRSMGGLRVLAPMPYAEYLRNMAKHRLVLQRDESGVPGQIAGDSVLTGTPCLGGNGEIDRLVFSHLPNASDSVESVIVSATQLLSDDRGWHSAVAISREKAHQLASFSAFRNAFRAAWLARQP